MKARLALVGALVVLLVGGALRGREMPEHRETLYVFGTLVEVVIRGEPEERARAAVSEVGLHFQRVHEDWHAWRPGALGTLNHAISEGRVHRVDPGLLDVLRRGQRLACESGGLFEPAIGALVGLWGFHADTAPEGAPPSETEIAGLLVKRPRMADLHLAHESVSSHNPAVQLDLGGFAKGAALDRAADLLAARGIENAVLNAGGDVNVIGRHGARAWRVAIRDPFGWEAVAALSLQPGEVLYTSGNYERFFEHAGRRFAHILDPRTGRPVGEIVSASVLAREGALADAAATALAVAGPGHWVETAAAMGIESAMIIGQDGQMQATPAMAARLEPVSGQGQVAARVVDLPVAGAVPSHDCSAF
ncbi:MAG: FAD:protein FMN transferase [Pseudomonadota bacterium]